MTSARYVLQRHKDPHIKLYDSVKHQQFCGRQIIKIGVDKITQGWTLEGMALSEIFMMIF